MDKDGKRNAKSMEIVDALKVKRTGVTESSRHSKGEERDLHMDNMKQTNAKGKETHIQE